MAEMPRMSVAEALSGMDREQRKWFTAGLGLAYGAVFDEFAREAGKPKMSLIAVCERLQEQFEATMAEVAISEFRQ